MSWHCADLWLYLLPSGQVVVELGVDASLCLNWIRNFFCTMWPLPTGSLGPGCPSHPLAQPTCVAPLEWPTASQTALFRPNPHQDWVPLLRSQPWPCLWSHHTCLALYSPVRSNQNVVRDCLAQHPAGPAGSWLGCQGYLPVSWPHVETWGWVKLICRQSLGCNILGRWHQLTPTLCSV